MFRCNLPPALSAEWPGSFTCHCGNTGVERTPNKSQHTKLTPEKKTLPPLLSGCEFATFPSRVRRSTNKLFRLPLKDLHTVLYPENRCFSSFSKNNLTFVTRPRSRTLFRFGYRLHCVGRRGIVTRVLDLAVILLFNTPLIFLFHWFIICYLPVW